MAVKIKDVSYKNLLTNSNIEFEKGKITSIVGKSGSGKTTIFDLIFGQQLNFEGTILLGKKILDKSKKDKQIREIRKNIFYLKQDYYNQLFNINILEDIKYQVPNIKEDKLNELLKSFGLDNSILTKHYTELSYGQIKKILLIIMFLSNKKILLLDDITTDLDFKGKKALIKQLKKIKREEKVIIISSGDTNFLLEIVDKIIYINNQKLIVEDNKYNFFENKTILNKCNLEMPKILQFKDVALKNKKIKLLYRDNINDLIKDIYRNAK
ncbi:MAG: ABC transporter ATP-binding protein [Bacilli bacterium]|nr:ABC transporter ATP-binding protein [Bacilli bacterium]